MCGRYVSATSPQDIADYFGAASVAETLVEPNYNVAPTATVPTVRNGDDGPRVDLARWGLLPHWAKRRSDGARMINARSETVATKPAFRAAAKRRRCIVPADAFYEWTAIEHPNGGKAAKQPWCIRRSDGDLFAFAGLYEWWRDPEGDQDGPPILTCTVLTRAANKAMAPIHDRMPVMVAPSQWQAWLDADNDDITSLLANIPAVPDELLTIHAVSTAVNNSRSRGAELMLEVEPMTEHPDAAPSAEASAESSRDG